MQTPSTPRGSAEDFVAPSRLSDLGWDVIVIIVVTGSVVFPGPQPPFLHPSGPLLLLLPAFVAAALLMLRRRWPIEIFAFCLLIYSATVLMKIPSIGAGIATVVAAFGLANRQSRRIAFAVGAVATGIVGVLSVTVADFGVVDPQVFQIAAGIAVATALGDSTRSRREYIAAVTERAERAEQTREAEALRRVSEERLRIARDLHDTVAHQISVISLNAGVASSALDDRPEKAREALGTIRTAARGVLAEIGELLRYLRTNEESTVESPQVGLQQLDALVQRMSGSGLDVEVTVAGDIARITGAVDLVAYRIVQEGLANAHKHGAGDTARVAIEIGQTTVRVMVTNPVAAGAARPPDTPSGHLGLIGMRERVAAVGGTVTTAHHGDQFQLTAELPLPRQMPA